jgi:hypothetical protein
MEYTRTYSNDALEREASPSKQYVGSGISVYNERPRSHLVTTSRNRQTLNTPEYPKVRYSYHSSTFSIMLERKINGKGGAMGFVDNFSA